MPQPDWLPPLALLEDFGGNWSDYEEALYQFFLDDFVRGTTLFRRSKIRLKHHPELNGKSATFWHITSAGAEETKRVPDLRRCERIRWPKPMIEKCDGPGFKVWKEMRKSEPRIHIWLEAVDYVVVLAVRKGYYLLWTAFLIQHRHQRAKFQRRFDTNK